MTDLFWGFTASAHVSLVQAERKKDASIMWVGKHSDCDFNISVFHDLKGPPSIVGRHKLEGEVLNSALSMFQRGIPAYAMSCEQKIALAESYAAWFHMIIQKRGVRRIFFTHVPHLGAELLLLDACRAQGVFVFMFYQSLFPDAFFIAQDCTEIGNFVLENHTKECRSIQVELGVAEKKLFYMNNLPIRMSNVRWGCSTFLRRLRKYLRGKSGGLAILGLWNAFQARREFEYYSQCFVESSLPDKFVYFGLHLQPELTTNPLGGIFDDQVAAIETLREWLPSNITIVVKENPKQDFEQRSLCFYKRLVALDNVVLAARDVNTYELLRRSLFVATITGTLGWEAITCGKAAMIFGNPWYGGLPGVFRLSADLELRELIEFKQNFVLFRQKLDELQTKLFPGVIDMGYLGIVSDYQFERNVERLRLAILACREFSQVASAS